MTVSPPGGPTVSSALEIDVRSCGGGAGPRPRLVVRSGQLRLAPGSDDVIMPAEGMDVVHLGDTTQVKYWMPGVGEIIARIDPLQAQDVEPGQRVRLGFVPGDAILVDEG